MEIFGDEEVLFAQLEDGRVLYRYSSKNRWWCYSTTSTIHQKVVEEDYRDEIVEFVSGQVKVYL